VLFYFKEFHYLIFSLCVVVDVTLSIKSTTVDSPSLLIKFVHFISQHKIKILTQYSRQSILKMRVLDTWILLYVLKHLYNILNHSIIGCSKTQAKGRFSLGIEGGAGGHCYRSNLPTSRPECLPNLPGTAGGVCKECYCRTATACIF